jgi:hypothetical protein
LRRGALRGRGAAALATTALLITPLLAGCGGGDAGPKLAWDGRPQVVRHPEIPGDVLVTARVRNESDAELRLDASDVRVVDSSGRPIRAAATFAAGYSHSLYPPRDAPRETPRAESERLGRAATVAPGEAVPLTVAWHRPRDGRAVRIEVGGEELALP